MKKIFSIFPVLYFFTIILVILPRICNGQSNTKTEITLLSFNVWQGGTNVSDGQSKVLNAVLISGADIVGISEATAGIGNIIADRLGWYRYVTNNNDIISRFPIIQTWNSVKGVGAEIEVENGKIIVLKTVHLNYTPYGPYRACLDGASVNQIINEETSSGRMGEIKAALNSIDTYLKDGTPTFLMGDLNTPSHLDWIASAANNHCGYIVEWPVTKAIEDSGMVDSYREAYPNPEAFPGITWSPIYQTYVYPNGKPEPLDRIDFIYYTGDSVEMQNSEIFVVGTPEQIPNHWQNEWPSDHSAVVSSFSVETGAEVSGLPVAKFYSSTPVIMQGENISFTDISTNNPTSWSWIFEGGSPATSTEQNPIVTYGAIGHYSVTLVSTNAEGSDTTTVTDLIIVKPGVDLINLSTDYEIYNLDEPITVSFSNGPGNPTDWIGIYKVGDIPGVNQSTLWFYVNGTQTATDSISDGSVTFAEGLSDQGMYWAGFFENDGYTLLDSISFSVSDLTDVDTEHNDVQIPKILTLKNYPNPFNTATKISYSIPRSAMVTIKVYDVLGKSIATLVDEIKQPGNYEVHFDGSNLASGIYMYSIKMGNETLTKKMFLMK